MSEELEIKLFIGKRLSNMIKAENWIFGMPKIWHFLLKSCKVCK